MLALVGWPNFDESTNWPSRLADGYVYVPTCCQSNSPRPSDMIWFNPSTLGSATLDMLWRVVRSVPNGLFRLRWGEHMKKFWMLLMQLDWTFFPSVSLFSTKIWFRSSDCKKANHQHHHQEQTIFHWVKIGGRKLLQLHKSRTIKWSVSSKHERVEKGVNGAEIGCKSFHKQQHDECVFGIQFGKMNPQTAIVQDW